MKKKCNKCGKVTVHVKGQCMECREVFKERIIQKDAKDNKALERQQT